MLHLRRVQNDLVFAGRYVIERMLGGGRFAEVWAARDQKTETSVALKVLREEHRTSARVRERFALESELLDRLIHPHIPRLVDADTKGVAPFFALTLAPGRPLRALIDEHIAQNRPIGKPALIALIEQIGSALDYSHALGIVHRDVKPKNILIEEDGRAIHSTIVDFGIAKMVDRPVDESTTHGRVLGALTYLSPEQIEAKLIDHRADVFALGTLTFELLTLRQPWIRDTANKPIAFVTSKELGLSVNAQVVMNRIAREPRPALREYCEGASVALGEIIDRALAINPEHRFANIGDFVRDFVRELSSLETRPVEGTFVKDVTTVNAPTRHVAHVETKTIAMAKRPSRITRATAMGMLLAAAAAATIEVAEDAPQAREAAAIAGVQPTVQPRIATVERVSGYESPAEVPLEKPRKRRTRSDRWDEEENELRSFERLLDTLASKQDDPDTIKNALEKISEMSRKLSDPRIGAALEQQAKSAAFILDGARVERAGRDVLANLRKTP